MKFSNYNIFIELNSEEQLLVNTLTGSMFKVDNYIEFYNSKRLQTKQLRSKSS